MPHNLELSIEWTGDVLCIELDGQLAAVTADRLVHEIDTTLDNTPRPLRAVLLNCSKLDYISGYGWHSMLLIGQSLRRRGVRLLLAELQPQLRIVFANRTFLGLLSIHATTAEALDSLS